MFTLAKATGVLSPFVVLLALLLAGCGSQEFAKADARGDYQDDVIDHKLKVALEHAGADEKVPIIVTLSDEIDFESLRQVRRDVRRARMIRAMKEKARETQGPIAELLQARGVGSVAPLWIINAMALEADADTIGDLAEQPGIESIRMDALLAEPVSAGAQASVAEWNLRSIGADQLWDMGFTGEGIVIASMDSGVDHLHPDLANRWRGGTNSWFDPNGEHEIPHDASGHGTQTMGIMVGGSAGGTASGVAPGSEWIAVKIFDDAGYASLSAIHLGYQWLLDPDGDPDTDDAPDIVNNSWGLTDHTGECVPEFTQDIQALELAGIAQVFSAGNGGPGSATSLSPANYPESVAVGAVSDAGTIARFSSRGPSSCGGGLYPEVVAPGVNIRTADLTAGGVFPNSYAYVSGTSFASAHAAGAMALLMGAFPDALASEIRSALSQTAVDMGAIGADYDYGYGLLDIAGAYISIIDPTGCGDCGGGGPGIDSVTAIYSMRTDTLIVHAASDLGESAGLVLLDYGPMQWSDEYQRWEITVTNAGGYPGAVTVSGIEGTLSVSVRSTRRALASLPAPSDLMVVSEGRRSMSIAWIDNSADEIGFKIERARSADGPFAIIAWVGEDQTTYADAGLSRGESYFYRVRAFSGAGNSEPSNVVWAIPQ